MVSFAIGMCLPPRYKYKWCHPVISGALLYMSPALQLKCCVRLVDYFYATRLRHFMFTPTPVSSGHLLGPPARCDQHSSSVAETFVDYYCCTAVVPYTHDI